MTHARLMRSVAAAALTLGLALATGAEAQPGQKHGGGNPGGHGGAASFAGASHHPGGMGRTQSFAAHTHGAPGFGAMHGVRTQSFAGRTHGAFRGPARGRSLAAGSRGHGMVARNGVAHAAATTAFRGRSYHSPFGGAAGFRPGGARPAYSARSFPHGVNASVRFHWRQGSWAGPPGWRYRRFFFGQLFPLAWCGPSWWIDYYWWYELPVPPWGYAWVRNGPDALLINVRTGYIVEVVYDVFY
jgi:hypothetical protein